MFKSLFGSYAGRFLAIGLVALLIQGASAHTYLSSLVIDGVALPEGECVRAHPLVTYASPISLVNSTNMTCGFLPEAAEPTNRSCPVTAGSQIGVQWHHNNDLPGDDILDSSHKGPIMFYLANSADGAGDVWFKIWEDGYDATTQLWATDRMIANGGLNTFTIPADIAPGNYLLRAEVLALHMAYELNGVQPYVGCAELTISGSGTNTPAGVAFPGAYLDTDPGILINIYTTFQLPYPFPGPAYYEGDSSEAENTGSTAGASSGTATTEPTSPPSTSGSSSQPTSAPTNPPVSSGSSTPSSGSSTPSSGSSTPSSSGAATGGSLMIEMNEGSSTWWLGVIVSGGSQATASVEIMDSGAVSSWTALQQLSYAWVFSQSIQMTLPISVRLTSSSGDQVTLTDAFTEWSQEGPVDAGDYSSSASATPTSAPASVAPSSPTSAPSDSSAGASVSLTVYTAASQWWFAVAVDSTASIASIEIKDSGSYTSYVLMNYAEWGYYVPATGQPFTAPLTLRITNEAGAAVTATVATITPGDVIAASGSL